MHYVSELHLTDLILADVYTHGDQINSPDHHFNGLVVNRFGETYTFDRLSASLLQINSEGEIIGKNGSEGRGPNEFDLNISGVGVEVCGDDYIIAYDMNSPYIQKYDRSLNFLGSKNVNGTIWWISCNNYGDYLIHYRNSNTTVVYNSDGYVLSAFTIDSLASDRFAAFKQFTLTEQRIFVSYLTKNVLLVLDREGKILTKTTFPAKTIDENKPATVQTYRSFWYNNDVYILTLMDGFNALHVFDSDGTYKVTHKMDDEIKNIFKWSNEYIVTLEKDNSILRKSKIMEAAF